jgi:hypothetical protein
MFRVKDGVIVQDATTGSLTPIAYRDGTPTHFLDEKSGAVYSPTQLTPATQHHVGDFEDAREKTKAIVGIGGAPARATTLPDDAKSRKEYPIASGFLDYFPDAVAAISNVSYRGGQQHHPDKPLHWDRNKSKDEADTMMRHFLQRGTLDTDGTRHMAKAAWRCLALLQKEIEAEKHENPSE